MGCGGFGEDRAAVCRGCSTGVSLEEHRDQKRAQGLQQQWGTQGLKGGSYSSVHLRAGSSEKQKSLLGHRTPGSWNRVGWWESAKPQGHLSKQPQGISAAPAPPPRGWEDKSDRHPAWASHPEHCGRDPSALSGRQGCSVVHSSWSTVQAQQLNLNHYQIPDPAGFAAPAQYPLPSREVEKGIFSTS